MGKIKWYHQRAAQPEGTAPERAPLEARELQVRVACKGRAAAEVLDELSRGLADAVAKGMDPLIVLEDLGLLADSITAFIKGLCRLLAGYPRTVTFWESSGYTEAFLTVMDGPTNPGGKPPTP
jgi:hypothetical protein